MHGNQFQRERVEFDQLLGSLYERVRDGSTEDWDDWDYIQRQTKALHVLAKAIQKNLDSLTQGR